MLDKNQARAAADALSQQRPGPGREGTTHHWTKLVLAVVAGAVFGAAGYLSSAGSPIVAGLLSGGWAAFLVLAFYRR